MGAAGISSKDTYSLPIEVAREPARHHAQCERVTPHNGVRAGRLERRSWASEHRQLWLRVQYRVLNAVLGPGDPRADILEWRSVAPGSSSALRGTWPAVLRLLREGVPRPRTRWYEQLSETRLQAWVSNVEVVMRMRYLSAVDDARGAAQ